MNNNQKATKRALLTSVMALVMCVVMLVGTTFAWFTDTASTGVNKIQAGNLDVELLMHNGEKYVNISKEKKPIFGSDTSTVAQNNNLNTLWEPGKTQVAYLAIENKGNLALKYQVIITGINGSAKLNEAIEWTIGDVAMGAEQHLKAGESNEFTIKGHMKESAGNEYMNESISGISITVYATQDTVESDSFNNTYDANATYPVVNVTELKEALTNGGIDTGVNGGYGINVKDGATLTINGGYYYGGGTAVQVQEGTLIINGGTFACEPFGDPYGYNFLINCVDGAYKNGTAKAIIQGGTFINFDPSNDSAEGAAPTSWPMATRSCLRLRPTAMFGTPWSRAKPTAAS